MLIHEPCVITPRLLPGLRVGDGFISVEYLGEVDRRGALYASVGWTIGDVPRFRYYIDTPEFEYEDTDLSGWDGLNGALTALTSFLLAAIEAYGYEQWSGRKCDNSDLFPEHVLGWISQYREELYLDEDATLIEE